MSDVLDLIDTAAVRWPGTPAVRDLTGHHTYAELAAASQTVAQGLRAMGVGLGDRVLLHRPGGREFAALLYGVLRAGAVAVPVHTATGPFHLQWMIEDARPRVVVTEDAGLAATSGLPAINLAALVRAGAGGRAPLPPVTREAIALLLYTSGSTGLPRAVVCPHERVRFAVDSIAARLRYRSDDVVLSRVPVSFDYGLYQMFLCAQAGACLVVRPDLVEAALLREARAVGATVLPIVASLGTILLRLARRDPGPTRVRLVTNTGAKLSPSLMAGLSELFPGADIVPMYGMTECKRITIADPLEAQQFPGTVGRALPGTTVLVVDDRGQPAGSGMVGEIWVRGPHVMAGYWRAGPASTERFHCAPDGALTLRTGDYGYLDPDGRLYFAGRRDDVFKRRSVRMNTQELEAAALDIPGVAAAAVLPPDLDGTLTAFVVGKLEPSAVLAGLAARVEPAKVPDRCVVLATLPTNDNGKVDRAALRCLGRGEPIPDPA